MKTLEKAWIDKATGYACEVLKFSRPDLPWMKEYYCGYVTFHPAPSFKVMDEDYDAFEDVLVHGGVTFVQNIYSEGRITVGFDCAHFCDFLPDGRTHWKLEDVIEQTELLAIGIRDKMRDQNVKTENAG